MLGRTARQHHMVGSNDRRISASIWVSVNSTNGLKLIAPPTLLIRTSIRPNRLRAAAIAVAAPEVPLQVRDEPDRLRALARQLLGDLLHEIGTIHQGDRAPLPGRPGGHRLPRGLAPHR